MQTHCAIRTDNSTVHSIARKQSYKYVAGGWASEYRSRPDEAVAAVGGEHDDGRDRRLERAVQVREALEVEHVDLVDEQHAGHELGDALLDVARDHLVDLAPQLVRDLCLLRLHQLPDHRHHVLPALHAVHSSDLACTDVH